MFSNFFSKFVQGTSFPYTIRETYYESSHSWKLCICNHSSSTQSLTAIQLNHEFSNKEDASEAHKLMIKYRHPFLSPVIDVSSTSSTYTIVTSLFIPLSLFLNDGEMRRLSIPHAELFSHICSEYTSSAAIFDLLIRHLFESLSFAHSNGLVIFSSCQTPIEAASLLCLTLSGQLVISTVGLTSPESNRLDKMIAHDYKMIGDVISLVQSRFSTRFNKKLLRLGSLMKQSNGDVSIFGDLLESLAVKEFDLFDRLMTLSVIAPRGRFILLKEILEKSCVFPSNLIGYSIISSLLSAVDSPSLNDDVDDDVTIKNKGDRKFIMTVIFDLVDKIKARNQCDLIVDDVITRHVIPTVESILSDQNLIEPKIIPICHSISRLSNYCNFEPGLRCIFKNLCTLVLNPKLSFPVHSSASKALISLSVAHNLTSSIKSDLNRVVIRLINDKNLQLKSLGLVLASKTMDLINSKCVNLMCSVIAKINLESAPSHVLTAVCVLCQSMSQSDLIDCGLIVASLLPTVSKLSLSVDYALAKSSVSAMKSLVLRLEEDVEKRKEMNQDEQQEVSESEEEVDDVIDDVIDDVVLEEDQKSESNLIDVDPEGWFDGDDFLSDDGVLDQTTSLKVKSPQKSPILEPSLPKVVEPERPKITETFSDFDWTDDVAPVKPKAVNTLSLKRKGRRLGAVRVSPNC
ncbi:hypothetical protein P9112_005510 [Eukaryota sp. TZLM1-RC]